MLMGVIVLAVSLAFFALLAGPSAPASAEQIEKEGAFRCKPTEPDQLGPMYEPGAPVRTQVGKGYLLEGAVKSARDCSPIPGARIEFWLVNLDGNYDDDHRATVPVNPSGGYTFESNFPRSYGGRPAHIHVRVTAPGYKTLVTQHYPKAGDTRVTYDLVLAPAEAS
jgi:protocatechuate 3,4-dioxygenase beta subunit